MHESIVQVPCCAICVHRKWVHNWMCIWNRSWYTISIIHKYILVSVTCLISSCMDS